MKKTYLSTLGLLAFNILNAQINTDSLNLINLNEVVFSANRTEEKKSDVPYTIQVMDSKTIALENPQTSADMLANTGNVMVQKSQGGGGSPIIRGFEANRVLIVIDGVRMNNAIYRAGHLQDVITIDNAMLDRTEVVFGPSSVMYGSDAIGGVMHFYTKKPLLSEDDKMNFKANSYVRYASANQEKTGHVDFNLGFKNIASLTSITYSDFDDLRTGSARNPNPTFGRCEYYAQRNVAGTADSMVKNSNPAIQKRTGYSQVDIMEKLLFKINDNVNIGANIQYSTSSDINRYDRLTEYGGAKLKYAEWYYGPQNRLLTSVYSTIKSDGKLFDNAKITGAYQNIDQSRISRKFNNNKKKSQIENVKVISLNADFNKAINDKNELRYGLELSNNKVSSTATTKNIVTDADITPTDTRYPNGGSKTMNTAIYLTHSWKINEKTILSEGVRFTAYSLESKFDTAASVSPFQFPFTSVKQKNNALNGNIGLVIMPEKNVRFSILGSTGFRSPNVDDMSKVFESGGNVLIVPNADLKPEYAYNLESSLGTTVLNEKLKIEGGYYFTLLKNAIVTQNAQYNGKDSIFFNGSMSKVFMPKNADYATVQGAWASLYADLNDNISLKSSINYTYGEYHDKQNDTILPMDHIPPVFGQTSLFIHYKKIESELYTRYSASKLARDYALGKEDNEIYSADPVNGYMPSWVTLNLKTAYHVTKYFSVNLGVENLFNTHYRVFASGISSPGRNVMVALRIKL
jgi:hemoglobin/transferrin/lactoferrin receptor protein